MAIDEKTRLRMRGWFATHMDPDLADAVMEAMPPLDYDQFATKPDLDNLRTGLKGDMSELRVEMAELRTDLQGEMAELRIELKGDIARVEMRLADMHADLTTAIASGQISTLRWSLAMQLMTLGSIGGLLTYLL